MNDALQLSCFSQSLSPFPVDPPFFLLPLPPSLAKRCVRTAVPSLLQTVTHTEFQPGGNLIQKIIPTADENMGTKEEEEEKKITERERMRQELEQN